ncbi:hypothetical protein SDJN02_01362 [Cucurbita argyrosperma subsp. argyrosperma]|nr:hypothetical protein SDJN02_01362 [Cucurbita argyrosperma subsp. argyrosperma]
MEPNWGVDWKMSVEQNEPFKLWQRSGSCPNGTISNSQNSVNKTLWKEIFLMKAPNSGKSQSFYGHPVYGRVQLHWRYKEQINVGTLSFDLPR